MDEIKLTNLIQNIDELRSFIENLITIRSYDNFSNYSITDRIDLNQDQFNDYLSRPDLNTYVDLIDTYMPNLQLSDPITEKRTELINNFLNHLQKKQYFVKMCDILNLEQSYVISVINNIFFNQYTLFYTEQTNTCAFKHIFLGEYYKKKLLGFHSWIQIFRKIILYQMTQIHVSESEQIGQNKIAIISFKIDNKKKSFNSIIFGISPYVEICIYTIVYLYNKAFEQTYNLTSESNKLLFDLSDNYPAIKYKQYNFKNYIRSIYPALLVNNIKNNKDLSVNQNPDKSG
jgi:hypothetical protein